MRRITALAAAVVLTLVAALPVAAAPKGGHPQRIFELVQGNRKQSSVVEGQSDFDVSPTECYEDAVCVFNPTPCLWNIDDRVGWGSSGKFLPGVQERSDCVIADDALHLLIVSIRAPSPDLIVTVTFQPQDVLWTFTPVVNLYGYGWDYKGCVQGPSYAEVLYPPAVAIPDSNGGRGVWTTFTVHVENPTSRTVKDVSGGAAYRSSDGSHVAGCGGLGPAFKLGGAVWKMGFIGAVL